VQVHETLGRGLIEGVSRVIGCKVEVVQRLRAAPAVDRDVPAVQHQADLAGDVDTVAKRGVVLLDRADKVAAARASVAAAQANISRLRGPARSTQLDVAAAGISQAQASRAQVAAPAREVDLTVARVSIDAAKVALDQATLDRDQATLAAPITGTVARIDLDVGALTGPTSTAVVLADLSSWRIETENLTELEVVKLREGQVVDVTFDALPDVSLPGTVTQIKPIGTNRQGDIVYTVVVALQKEDARLRWNMTAVVTATQ